MNTKSTDSGGRRIETSVPRTVVKFSIPSVVAFHPDGNVVVGLDENRIVIPESEIYEVAD